MCYDSLSPFSSESSPPPSLDPPTPTHPLMKTRIVMKVRLIWPPCLPTLGIKQGQNPESECVPPRYYDVRLVTSCFSWASSHLCRETQLKPAACLSPMQLSRYRVHLLAAAARLTTCRAGPLPTRGHEPVVYGIQQRRPGRRGFAGSVALHFHIPRLLLEALPDGAC